MKSITFIHVLIVFFYISSECCHAQDDKSVDHVVYMIGNTATSEMNEAQLASLQKQLLTEEAPFTLLHLGDIVNPGLHDSWKSELDHIFKLVDGRENGQVIFTPGDKDWNNSGRDGLKMVRELEKLVESQKDGANIFLPSEGCPGP